MALPGEPKLAQEGTSHTVVILGVLNILYGLGGVFLQILPFMLVKLFPPRQALDVHFSPFTLGFALSIMFIIGGAGFLFFMRWGLILSGFAAIGIIALNMFSFVRSIVYELGAGGEESLLLGFLFAAFFMALFLLYPALLLVFLGRSSIRAQFEK